MPTFPTLKTGAVSQYPLECATRFQTQAVRFLDGSQQKYRLYGQGLRRWAVQLELLDDREFAALALFAEQQQSSTFAFTDPVSGQSVAKCVISGDRLDSTAQGEMRNAVRFAIEEIV